MNTTKRIDFVSSKLDSEAMPTQEDIVESLLRLLKYQCSRIAEDREEMLKNEESYRRFLDLRRDADSREDRVHRLMGLIGPDHFFEGADQQIIERGLFGDDPDEVQALRERLSLWEAISEYLAVAGETRISQVQVFLNHMGIKATRSAIDSALRQHGEAFKIRKRGRDKYVARKGDHGLEGGRGETGKRIRP